VIRKPMTSFGWLTGENSAVSGARRPAALARAVQIISQVPFAFQSLTRAWMVTRRAIIDSAMPITRHHGQ
jgi:hypothetical protein